MGLSQAQLRQENEGERDLQSQIVSVELLLSRDEKPESNLEFNIFC